MPEPQEWFREDAATVQCEYAPTSTCASQMALLARHALCDVQYSVRLLDRGLQMVGGVVKIWTFPRLTFILGLVPFLFNTPFSFFLVSADNDCMIIRELPSFLDPVHLRSTMWGLSGEEGPSLHSFGYSIPTLRAHLVQLHCIFSPRFGR